MMTDKVPPLPRISAGCVWQATAGGRNGPQSFDDTDYLSRVGFIMRPLTFISVGALFGTPKSILPSEIILIGDDANQIHSEHA